MSFADFWLVRELAFVHTNRSQERRIYVVGLGSSLQHTPCFLGSCDRRLRLVCSCESSLACVAENLRRGRSRVGGGAFADTTGYFGAPASGSGVSAETTMMVILLDFTISLSGSSEMCRDN